MQADGRFGEFGFSFHDRFEFFKEVVDAYDWRFCQIQYNFVNEDVQAGAQGLKYAAEKGLGVIIMEPLFGGTLANPPDPVREIWQAAGRKPADVALRWLWDKPEVSFVLSGMNRIGQVDENVETAGRAGVGQFSDEERQLVSRVQEKYKELSPIPCTKCGYCLPCPHGVNIPLNIELYNSATLFKGNPSALPEPVPRPAGERTGKGVPGLRDVRGALPAGHRNRQADGRSGRDISLTAGCSRRIRTRAPSSWKFRRQAERPCSGRLPQGITPAPDRRDVARPP